MPLNIDYMANQFDLDLDFGKVGEMYIESVFEGNGTIEVKTERDIWKTTGNIAIEIRCNGKLSGLSTTEAHTWIHLLSYENMIVGGFLFKVEDLKEKIRKLADENSLCIVMGGDYNAAQMVLLPIKELFI